ncbi:endonuclease domain-containing protein [Nocardioides kongjuensis]
MSATRRLLVDALGPTCHCCGERYPYAIDHDHETGIVRGYLCRDCNARIERCVHLSGCRFAEYLNSPPAEPLGLRHPKPVQRRDRASATAVAAQARTLVSQIVEG